MDKKIKAPQFYRQKFILALLYVFGKKMNKTDFQKYLFLYQYEYSKDNPNYYFLPYKYGPFSFQAYADLRRMEELGHLKSADYIELLSDNNYYSMLKENDKIAVRELHKDYHNIKGRGLIERVYAKYPYFASKSNIKHSILQNNFDETEKDETLTLFTLGYEGLTIDQYLNNIILNNIKTVIDVRKNPVSMKYGFSKKTLQNALAQLEIGYIHIPELGIQSEARQNLDSLNSYKILFKQYEATLINRKKEIQKIVKEYEVNKRIMLTCFEKDFKFCHRSCIAKGIENEYGIKAVHL